MKNASERVKIYQTGDAIVIFVLKDVLDDAEDFKGAIERALKGNNGRIIIDLSGARYVSARVLGFIADGVRKARGKRRELKIVCPNPLLKRFLETIGICYAVEILASMEEALHGLTDGILTPEKIILWKDSEAYARA